MILILTLTASTECTQKSNKKQTTQENSVKNIIANYGKYNFSFRTLDGKPIKLSDYAGKVVLVNIWAPWCGPCRMETPGFVRLYDKYHKRGLEILGVAVQTNEGDVRAFIEKYKVKWQIGIKDEVARAYGAYGIPDSYLFRSNGSLIKEYIGYASEEALEPLIKDALNLVK